MAVRAAIRIKGLDDLLEKAARLPDNVRRDLDDTLLAETFEVAALAKQKAPVDTGILRSQIVAEQIGELQYQVAARSKHAAHVEYGTRPHFPPIDALVPWVRRVIRPAPDQVRRVAFLVARKISRTGTPEQAFMRPALLDRLPMIRAAIETAFGRGVAK